MLINTGCSGFYNKHWKGVFYPENMENKDWLNYYTQHFNTLELNNTFYQFPTELKFRNWYNKCPSDFIFSVKAPKLITHFHKLLNCENYVNDFYRVCENGLKSKLGCLLFQLPPSFHYSEEKLELIVKTMRSGFKNVVEFRHESWWNLNVYKVLESHNIIFCNVNHPKLPTDVIVNTKTTYVRLHGNPIVFYSNYDKIFLKELHAKLENNKRIEEAFVYFNNTAGTAGILNAQEFQSM